MEVMTLRKIAAKLGCSMASVQLIEASALNKLRAHLGLPLAENWQTRERARCKTRKRCGRCGGLGHNRQTCGR
jgi:hypothetical protein